MPERFYEPSKGRHSRGYLPHYDGAVIQAVTFRLADSMPSSVIEEWKRELRWDGPIEPDSEMAAELRRRAIKYEDAGHGACHLRNPEVATLVRGALLRFDGDRYDLIAWCIMPNHVHALLRPRERGDRAEPEEKGRQDACAPGMWPLSSILHSWKSFTAQRANRILGLSDAPFWQRESFDRYIRDEAHLRSTIDYIHDNPVKARLCISPDDWPWSSACAANAKAAGGVS